MPPKTAGKSLKRFLTNKLNLGEWDYDIMPIVSKQINFNLNN